MHAAFLRIMLVRCVLRVRDYCWHAVCDSLPIERERATVEGRTKMAKFNVIRIVDGDTFDVSPDWRWNGTSGNRVRPAGYDAAEIGTRGGTAATQALAGLTLGKTVELGTAYRVDRGRLVCEVFFNGHNLKDYFK
jgi:endonuclease YncB( thermonuclease family)